MRTHVMVILSVICMCLITGCAGSVDGIIKSTTTPEVTFYPYPYVPEVANAGDMHVLSIRQYQNKSDPKDIVLSAHVRRFMASQPGDDNSNDFSAIYYFSPADGFVFGYYNEAINALELRRVPIEEKYQPKGGFKYANDARFNNEEQFAKAYQFTKHTDFFIDPESMKYGYQSALIGESRKFTCRLYDDFASFYGPEAPAQYYFHLIEIYKNPIYIPPYRNCQETWSDGPLRINSNGIVLQRRQTLIDGYVYIALPRGIARIKADRSFFEALKTPFALSPTSWIVPRSWVAPIVAEYPHTNRPPYNQVLEDMSRAVRQTLLSDFPFK